MAIKPKYYSIEVSTKIGNTEFCLFFRENICLKGKENVSVPHDHSKNYELRYISAGTGGQTVEGEHFTTRTGDLLLIHPNECHFQSVEDTSDNLEQYGIRFVLKNIEMWLCQ